jgi:hypothetical protein
MIDADDRGIRLKYILVLQEKHRISEYLKSCDVINLRCLETLSIFEHTGHMVERPGSSSIYDHLWTFWTT